jgi:hypothetical protein
MQNSGSININEMLPIILKQAFFIIIILGFYLSFLILLSSRFKLKITLLGMYSLCLSLISLDILLSEFLIEHYNNFFRIAGIGSIYIIGQILYQIDYYENNRSFRIKSLIHYLLPFLLIILISITNYSNSIFYIIGIIHCGIYFFVIGLKIYKNLNSLIIDWKIKYYFITFISYIIIIISIFYFHYYVFCIVALTIISFHILYLWISLLKASFRKRAIKNQQPINLKK